MNSLRMSFWTVPCSLARGTPCSSPTTTYIASRIAAVALMVIDVETRSSGIPWNSRSRSSTVSIATPARPPSAVGRENARGERHVVLATDHERGLLVQVLRDDVEDRPATIRRPAARLLHHERERRRLVQQAQLALRVVRGRGIQKDAAGNEIAMEVCDERADVAGVLRLDLPLAVLERAHHALHRRGPAVPVAFVDAVVLADRGGGDVGVRQQKLADRGIEGEAVHPLSRGVDEHRTRAVQDVARRDLLFP